MLFAHSSKDILFKPLSIKVYTLPTSSSFFHILARLVYNIITPNL